MSELRFKNAITFEFIVYACVHLGYALTMFSFNIIPGWIYNAISTAFYIVLTALTHTKIKRPYLYTACFLEISFFSFISTVLLGSSMQFSYFVFALLPIAFFFLQKMGEKKPMFVTLSYVISVLLIGLFYIENSVMYTLQPMYVLTIKETKVLVRANSTLGILFVFFSFCLFSLQNNKKIDSLVKRNRKLQSEVNIDELTQVMNRKPMRFYFDRLVEDKSSFSVIMFDIDDFKKFNDTYGHQFGDVVLKKVTLAIKSKIKKDGTLFRWGGEELLVLFSSDINGSLSIAEECRQAVEKEKVDCNGIEVAVTVTAGVAQYKNKTLEETVEDADKALYFGKNNGKNMVVEAE